MVGKKKNKLKILIVVMFLIAPFLQVSFASAEDPTVRKERVLVDCDEVSHYNNALSAECNEEQLSLFNADIQTALQDIYLNKTSQFGPEADKEIKDRIKSAQKNWEQYRQDHCAFFFYKKAQSIAPSRNLAAVRCKARMTANRLMEINDTYINF